MKREAIEMVLSNFLIEQEVFSGAELGEDQMFAPGGISNKEKELCNILSQEIVEFLIKLEVLYFKEKTDTAQSVAKGNNGI